MILIKYILNKNIIIISIFFVILLTKITLLDILSSIWQILSMFFSGLVPMIMAIIAYFLKQWWSFKKTYKESLLKCLWTVKQNTSFLDLIKLNNMDRNLIIEKLELIPPYLEDYSYFVDNSLRKHLIFYNTQIIKLKVSQQHNEKDFSNISLLQTSTIQIIDGYINLVDKVFNNPLSFFTLPHIIKFITNKFFKHPSNNKHK